MLAARGKEKTITAVETGYNELMARAEMLSDLEGRLDFMESTREHREMVHLWERINV